MPTTRHDITVNQGSAFKLNVQALNSDRTVMNLTGYSARMQIRSAPGVTPILLDASTSNGRITINASGGIVMVNVGADVTTSMVWNSGIYDLEIFTDAANVIRLVSGFASLSVEVTA